MSSTRTSLDMASRNETHYWEAVARFLFPDVPEEIQARDLLRKAALREGKLGSNAHNQAMSSLLLIDEAYSAAMRCLENVEVVGYLPSLLCQEHVYKLLAESWPQTWGDNLTKFRAQRTKLSKMVDNNAVEEATRYLALR